MTERIIRSRRPEIEAAAANLSGEDRKYFLESAQRSGWYEDLVVEEDGEIIATLSDMGWAKAIQRGETPTKENSTKATKKKKKWRKYEEM